MLALVLSRPGEEVCFMGLFFFIVGGALVGWGLLQVIGLLVMLLLFSREWSPQQERNVMLLVLPFLPALWTIDLIDRLARRFRFAPRQHLNSPWLLWWLGGIFIALGLLLSVLVR